ncbi:MAG: universal stress protein [Deltaproteobacteria bacterium]|nr:universal stress protein [Deltaproteobacteria bacterium]
MSDDPRPVRRILASIALSPRAEAVAGEAIELARRFGAALSFVHVGADDADRRERVAQVLARIAGDTPPPFEIRSGDPAEVICDAGRDAGADLIVAGALEKEGFLEGLRGSVARRIARLAPCSALLITEPSREGSLSGRVVVGIGDPSTGSGESDDGDGLVRFAAAFAQATGAKYLHLVREFDPLVSRVAESSGETAVDPETQRLWATQARLELTELLAGVDTTGLVTEAACLEGRYGMEMVEYALRVEADLTIFPLPRRRLNFWDRFFHHSAENVLERLPCAVLFYREPESASKDGTSQEGS